MVVDGVAVFDFASVNVQAGAVLQGIQAFQSLPVATPSRSLVTISGVVDVSAFAHLGRAGAGYTGFGRSGAFGFDPTGTYASGGGGGSFGGVGGREADAVLPDGSRVPGDGRGSIYGDLAVKLQGGSGGAPGGYGSFTMAGGGGGGGIELGAVGSLTITGAVNAYGGFAFTVGAGGGSGGGIFLHAATLDVTGYLDVSGGAGGRGTPGTGSEAVMGGGGGGGGRILAMSGDASFTPGHLLLGGGSGNASFPNASVVGGNGSAGSSNSSRPPPSRAVVAPALRGRGAGRIRIRDGPTNAGRLNRLGATMPFRVVTVG